MNKQEERLLNEMARCAKDPWRFVMIAFPWQAKNTQLETQDGPDKWQTGILLEMKKALGTGGYTITMQEALRIAVASGHGPGKSALVAWIILWAMSTRPDTRVVVTANTMPQLMTKTWPELSKWFNLLICKHWFTMTATRLASKDREETWRTDAVPWNETNTEAFAGLHNQGRRIVVIYDEASAIVDSIWEVTEGALTDEKTEIIWCAFGNPTRNTGRFRECFGRLRHRWKTFKVDSRTAKLTNKKQIEEWITDYGIDSDFVRVRVLGEFPRAGSQQFISLDLVEAAMSQERDNPCTFYDPLAIGVDVARFGDDATVIWFRRGPDARSIPPVKLRGADTMTVANTLNSIINNHHPQGVFIDAGGLGAGVIDRLRELGHKHVYGIDFGSRPSNANIKEEGAVAYANKRAEMWGAVRDWLARGMLPFDRELLADLTGVEYGYAMKDGRDAILLEKKDDMKKRGLASPDNGDALALCFAIPLPQADYSRQFMGKAKHESDYDPMAEAWAAGGVKQGPTNPSRAWMPGQAKGW